MTQAVDALVSGSPAAGSNTLWYTWLPDRIGDEWRESLQWPVNPLQLRTTGDGLCRAVLDTVAAEHDDFRRQALTVGAGQLVNVLVVLLEMGFVAQHASRTGARVVDAPPEYPSITADDAPVTAARSVNRGKGLDDLQRVKHATARSVARTLTWSGAAGLAGAWLARDGVALSHNNLLVHTLKRQGCKVRFRHAANMLLDARKARRGERGPGEAFVASLPQLVNALCAGVEGLDAPFRQRVERAALARLERAFGVITDDIAALRHTARMPSAVWTGTNGSYPTRVLCSEVRRRGGEVNAFDHGGVTGVSQMPALTALTECMLTTRFHVGTRKWAEVLEQAETLKLVAGLNAPVVEACDAEPTFRAACTDSVKRSTPRRVMYVSHPFYGHRQFAIAGLRDPVYIDFQTQVLQTLAALDVDLFVKPHPEGHFGGRAYPLAHMADVSYQRFEEHLQDTDLFVFDAPTSTTFAEAMCTRRPIVLIDRQHYPVNPALRAQIEARCTVVSARFTAANTLQLDTDALAQAVLYAAPEADPSWARELFAGLDTSPR